MTYELSREYFGVKIVVIGGGTGSFTLLSGLKKYTHSITALVNMVDDGGSTGMLRDELGVLRPEVHHEDGADGAGGSLAGRHLIRIAGAATGRLPPCRPLAPRLRR